MKNVSVLILSFFTYVISVTGQELSSFYFTEPQPADAEITSFAPDTILRYMSVEDSTRKLIVEGDTVFTAFRVYMVLTKRDLRKADSLEIRNEHLHGFIKNDSLPVVENKGKYFFGYPHKTPYFFPDDKRVVKKVSDGIYALNEMVNDQQWIVTLLVFDSPELRLVSFDHEVSGAMKPMESNIDQKEINSVTTYLASPSSGEFISFIRSGGFNDSERFILDK